MTGPIRGYKKKCGMFLAAVLILLLHAAAVHAAQQGVDPAPATQAPAAAGQAALGAQTGIITGTVQDSTGEIIPGVSVKLTPAAGSPAQTATTDANGSFSFANIIPGTFQIEVSAQGFQTQLLTGTLQAGDTFIVPPVTLPLSAVVTRVVVMPQEEQAAIEIHQEEKQRLLGVVPNFYVTYLPDPAPLTAKQKFQLAAKSSFDPITFGISAGVAGIEQGTGYLDGYGPGFTGYAKRFGASYGDIAASTMIGEAALPSVLRQDPRYFYKGTGSKPSRLLYAVGFTFFCKGDNRKWQPNYSNILGNFAAAGITTLYYPAQDRHTSAANFTVQNALIGFGASAAANVIEEFFSKKLTPKSERADGSPRKPILVARLATALIGEGQ